MLDGGQQLLRPILIDLRHIMRRQQQKLKILFFCIWSELLRVKSYNLHACCVCVVMRINENSSPFFCNADSCSDFNFTALNGKQHYCAIRTTTEYWRKEKFLCSHFPPHISHESFFLLAVVISKRDDRADDDDDNVGNFECMQKPCSVCVFMSGFYTNADREAE